MFRKLAGDLLNLIVSFDSLASSKTMPFWPEPHFGDASDYLLLYAGFEANKALLNVDNFPIYNLLPRSEIFICVNSANPKRISRANRGSKVFFRKNRGRDLGILRDFMRIVPEQLEKPILFINSSCYWDYKILNEKVTELLHVEDEIIFGTASLQHSLHVQTFFIWVPASCTEQFKSVFVSKKMIRNWHTKRSTVYLGEKRLLRWLLASNLKVSVLYHPEEFISKSERSTKNISIDFAEDLIKAGAPFLKRSTRLEPSITFQTYVPRSVANRFPLLP